MSEPLNFEPQAAPLTFSKEGDWYVRIHPDGRVELNENVTMDEAAQVFWEAVKAWQASHG